MKIEADVVLGLLRKARSSVCETCLLDLEQIIEEVDSIAMQQGQRLRMSRLDSERFKAVKGFLAGRVEFCEDAFVPNRAVYVAWMDYAQDKKLSADQGRMLAANAFSRLLGEVIGEGARRGRIQRASGVEDNHPSIVVTYGWFGMRLKEQPTPGGLTVEDVQP